MFAEIIAVGSELLTPHRQDTNSLYLTSVLNDLGVAVAFKTIVGDHREHLTSAIQIALSRADILLFSGGLGPTEDDLTRECVAQALQLPLYRNPELLETLRQRFAARNLPMTENNHHQADQIQGATILPNRNGSAPGQWLDILYNGHRRLIALLPGPPTELQPLFAAECKPRLAAALPPSHLARRQLRMTLIPESLVDARCAPIYKTFSDVETTILAGNAEIQLHFSCIKPTRDEAEARVEAAADAVSREMGDDVFSSGGESLEEILLLMLGVRHHTLAVAESCTGGLIGKRLTSIPNSSRVFLGGAVAYSNRSKTALADVPAYLIDEHGAVSEAVARALAEGIRRRIGSSLALSVTGIAGPAAPRGPDSQKPVGLVYVALTDGKDTQVKELNIRGDRERIRIWAAQHALEMLRRRLL
ncbi:MAG: competence/damage-inducible protein A [Acidobacteriaceae bacterium]